MELKRVEITELQGINRNAVEGVTQTQPTDLTGLTFGRAGGYRAYGAVNSQSLSSSIDGTFKGYDQTGLVGLISVTISGFLSTYVSVFNENQQFSVVDSFSNLADFCFIERVGLHATPFIRKDYGGIPVDTDAAFAVLDEDNNTFTAAVNPELTLSATAGGEFDSGTVIVSTYRYIKTPAGKHVIAHWQSDVSMSGGDNTLQITYPTGTGTSNTFVDVYASQYELYSSSGFNFGILFPPETPSKIYGNQFFLDSKTNSQFHTTASTSYEFLPTSYTLPHEVIFLNFRSNGVSHGNRVYGVPSANGNSYGTTSRDQAFTFFSNLPKDSIIYSEQQWTNLGLTSNWFTLPGSQNTEVTGLASTPAGLLIFGDRETFLMRSDPVLPDWQVQKVASYVGHTSDYPPAVVGGIVISVYQGDIYAFSFGMGDVDFGSGIQKISQPFSEVVNFTRVASEPGNRSIVALGDNGEAYRYELEYQQWVTEFMNSSSAFGSESLLVPSTSASGVLWFSSGSPLLNYERPFGGAIQEAASVTWEDVDLGDKDVTKQWRRVRIHMNDSYSGTPTLDYVINNTSGTLTGVNETGNRFTFTFPSGLVNEKAEELTLNLVSAVEGDTLEPPVVIEYSERYRRR